MHPAATAWRGLVALRTFAATYWFILGMVGAIALAASAPRLGSPHGPLLVERWNGLLVPVIFVISGALLRTHQIRAAVADWRLHVFIQGFNLLIIPVVFWAAAAVMRVSGFSEPLCLGFIVLGSLSTTTTTGVAFTRAAGGDEAGALFNATLGSLLGVLVSPLIILMATGKSAHIPFMGVCGALVMQVLVPIGAGHALQAVIGTWIERARRPLSTLSLGILLVLVWMMFCSCLERGFVLTAVQFTVVLIGVVILHVAVLAGAFHSSGWAVWRLSRPRRTAGVICSTQKTIALGLPMLLVMFPRDPTMGLMAMPLLMYHPLQLITSSLLAPRWQRWNAGQHR